MQHKEKAPDNKKLTIQAYSVSDEVENELKKSLEFILTRYELMELHHALYTCVKELVMNAIKANFKNIYFEDYRSTSGGPLISYEVALKLFMLEMTREDAQHLERIARKKDIKAVISIWTDKDFLHFNIYNPVPMTDVEQRNVKKKLDIAQKLHDISEYFLQSEEDPEREGAGLGLVLITMMLKGIVREKGKLNITSDGIGTTAVLTVPMRKEYLNIEAYTAS